MTDSKEGDIRKFEGVILGAALGDALGWPHEGRARGSIELSQGKLSLVSWTKRSGGRFQPHDEIIDTGSYSDDTQLIIAVSRSRLKHRIWWQYFAKVELPFWTIYQRGGGGASLRASRLLLKGVLPWESGAIDRRKYFDAGGNGVAMRIAPHCLLGAADPDFNRIAQNVFADGVLTHGHPIGLVGALAFAYALWIALRKTGTLEYGQLIEEVRSASDLWSNVPNIQDYWPTWGDAAKRNGFYDKWGKSVAELRRQLEIASAGLVTGALDFDEEIMGNIGCFDKKISGAGTVAAATAIFLASKHAVAPMEGVARAALAKGADTDTIASMTGAIAGAINGTDWFLPFSNKIQDNRYLSELALKLCMNTQETDFEWKPVTEADIDLLFLALGKGVAEVTCPLNHTLELLVTVALFLYLKRFR